VWVLLERVGNDSRIDPVTIGLVLSMSVLLGVVGALAAGILCDRAGRFSALFTAAIGLGATLRPQAAGAFIGGDSYAPVVFVCIAATLVGLVAAL
jgi:MFS family permease